MGAGLLPRGPLLEQGLPGWARRSGGREGLIELRQGAKDGRKPARSRM